MADLFNMERRKRQRKKLPYLEVSNIATLEPFTMICKTGELIDASATGFLLCVNRKHLIPKVLRDNLTLKSLEGEKIVLNIVDMDLNIDGQVARTRLISNGFYELAIDFSKDAPEYWRECLIDLLPEDLHKF